MKKMKKLFAILMTMAMVMGLGITGFAAPVDVDTSEDTQLQSSITVTGLSYGVYTDISGYKFATLQYDADTNEYSWLIADWADEYIDLNAAGTAFEIVEGKEADLKNAAINSRTTDASVTATDIFGTSYTFNDVPIGGYILIPKDDNNEADYSPLFAVNTYNRDGSPVNGKPVAETITVAAKSSGHTIVKEDQDDFAQIGQEVNYTIRATFPALTKGEDELESFVITDTSTGLAINENDITVKLGDVALKSGTDYTVNKTTSGTNETIVTITFDESLFLEGNVGKDIEISYEATVIDTEYNNTASANSSTTNYTSDETTGENGSISITKVDIDDEDKTPLAGAEFKVYDLGVNGIWNAQNPGNPMNFVYDTEEKAYRPALSTDEAEDITDTIIATNGVVKVVGLDEGNYHFKETKAPSGYAINDLGETYTIANEENKIDISEYFEDTKMAALPSTGGMGTTLFTIAGCVIMISAAGLFFATRKKAN